MNEKKTVMTIKEFAAAVGISEQAVYKQLNGKLSTFSTRLNGKKAIKIEALREYGFNQIQPEIQPEIQLFKPDIQLFQPKFNQELSEKEAEINRLKEQIQQQKVDDLSRQVEELKEQIREKNHQIESLHDLLRESQAALSRQQQLAALQEQRIVQLTASEPETAATVVHEEPEAEQIAAEQTAAEKKGLFRRILDVIRQQDSY